MPSVLVADHEPEVAEMVRRYLERASMHALVTHDPAQTLLALASRRADMFVIDLTMPGLEVRAVRQAIAAEVRVVFLLDRGDPRPHGLNSPPAVRRWLTRPFSPRALVVAVAGLLQPVSAPSRPADPAGPSGAVGRADHGRHEIVLRGRGVSLTRTEFVLVSALAQQPGRVLSRQRLLAALENERGKRPSARAVDVYVAQLRAKLGSDVIRTVHGVGYVLDLSGMPEGTWGAGATTRYGLCIAKANSRGVAESGFGWGLASVAQHFRFEGTTVPRECARRDPGWRACRSRRPAAARLA